MDAEQWLENLCLRSNNATNYVAMRPDEVKRLVAMVRVLAAGCDCDAEQCQYGHCTNECRMKMAYQQAALRG